MHQHWCFVLFILPETVCYSKESQINVPILFCWQDLSNQINELQALVTNVQEELGEKKTQWQNIKRSREDDDSARRSADLEKQRQDLEAQRIRFVDTAKTMTDASR